MTLSVHIIGGGPAGCATALALYQQAQRLEATKNQTTAVLNFKDLSCDSFLFTPNSRN